MRALALVGLVAVGALSGCVSSGSYKCQGVSVRAPIVPIGVQVGPCE